MALDPVILGFLKDGPQTGYQLKKRMDQSVANFWTISYGGLYPVLKKMAENGDIKENKQLSEKNRGTYYEITPAGKEKFARWLMDDYKQVVIKDEFLLKVFFSSDDELVQLLPQVKKRLREVESILEILDNLIQADKKKQVKNMTTGKRMTLHLGYEENMAEYNHIGQLKERIIELKGEKLKHESSKGV